MYIFLFIFSEIQVKRQWDNVYCTDNIQHITKTMLLRLEIIVKKSRIKITKNTAHFQKG